MTPHSNSGGVKREDVVGSKLWETEWFDVGDAAEKVREDVEKARSGEFVRHEQVVKGDDGKTVIDFSIRPVKGGDGDVRFLVPEGRDITELKKREHELEQREKELERRNRDLELLNQIMRHDIRNDMQYILTVSEILLEQKEKDEKLDGLVETAEHVVKLTEGVRGVIEMMGSGAEELERVRLDEVLVEEAENIASVENAEVEIDEPPAIEVYSNQMLGSVFRNLMKNAVDHTDGKVNINIDIEKHDDFVEIEIADDGPGIPDEEKKSVFERGKKNKTTASEPEWVYT